MTDCIGGMPSRGRHRHSVEVAERRASQRPLGRAGEAGRVEDAGRANDDGAVRLLFRRPWRDMAIGQCHGRSRRQRKRGRRADGRTSAVGRATGFRKLSPTSHQHRRGKTWSEDRPDDIPLTPVDAALARYSAKRDGHDRDRILFSAPQGEEGLNRNNLTLWTSYDEGQSFVDPTRLHRGFAAYSVIQRLSDGTIGVLVETTGNSEAAYGAITFYRIDLRELEAATPQSSSRK